MSVTHQRIDARSRAMHERIAQKLLVQPELLAVALENLERWQAGSDRARPYLDAWKAILLLPLEEVTRLIVEDSERMDAMRQSSPFAGVLNPKERWEIYDAFAVPRVAGIGGEQARQAMVFRGQDGFWVAECASLPGCVAQADTPEEALDQLRDAIHLYAAVLVEDQLPVPEESGATRT